MPGKDRRQKEAGLSRDANLCNFSDETPQVQEQGRWTLTALFMSGEVFRSALKQIYSVGDEIGTEDCKAP